jgi:membrane dipeptidase
MIFDAHLDLAMNAIEWNRDLTRPVDEIRKNEAHLRDKKGRGRGTVSLPEMRRASIGLCVATQIARVEHDAWSPVAGWRSPAQAWAMTQAQLAWYRAMQDAGEIKQLRTRDDLEKHLALWSGKNSGTQKSNSILPVGYILSLEGADSIISIRHLEKSAADGLRAIGPAHYGPGIYANGTDATGGFNARGRELLDEIARLGLILDVTHLCDDCFWEALENFHGPVWASHHNSRSLVPHNRQLSDEMIRALVERGAVIGSTLDAWMLVPDWVRGKTTPQSAGVTLAHAIEHIDHVCQIAGNALHSGIGSDLDGAFGTEQTPQDLDTIADIARIADLLRGRGFAQGDVENIMSGNFIRFLRETWR